MRNIQPRFQVGLLSNEHLGVEPEPVATDGRGARGEASYQHNYQGSGAQSPSGVQGLGLQPPGKLSQVMAKSRIET